MAVVVPLIAVFMTFPSLVIALMVPARDEAGRVVGGEERAERGGRLCTCCCLTSAEMAAPVERAAEVGETTAGEEAGGAARGEETEPEDEAIAKEEAEGGGAETGEGAGVGVGVSVVVAAVAEAVEVAQ
jgi:hypothetical protein